jgi:DnaK suppressor protein
MPRAAKETKSSRTTKAAGAKKGASAGKATSTARSAGSAKSAKSAKAAKPAKPTKPARSAPAVKSAKTVKAAKPVKSAKPVKAVAAAKPAKAAAKAAPKPARKAVTATNTPFEPYQTRRGEKYMNENQLEHFRAILLNWKSELMQEVDRTVTHMKDEAANFPDPADRATQEEEFSLELRTRDRERKLIKKIDATIELIDQDDYGYCEACGVEIGIQRLEARPTATQCIDCKTLAEIKEKQEMG